MRKVQAAGWGVCQPLQDLLTLSVLLLLLMLMLMLITMLLLLLLLMTMVSLLLLLMRRRMRTARLQWRKERRAGESERRQGGWRRWGRMIRSGRPRRWRGRQVQERGQQRGEVHERATPHHHD